MLSPAHGSPFGVTKVKDLDIKVLSDLRLANDFTAEVGKAYGQLCSPDETTWQNAGKPNPNGLQTSISKLQIRDGIISGDLQPTRFAWGQASAKVIKEQGESFAPKHSANMANTWLVCFVKYQGMWHISGQIKGANTVGGGQLHPALAAGGVSSKLLKPNSPVRDILISNLLKEAQEEGAPLSSFRSEAQIAFALDERKVGNIVFGYVGKSEIDDIKNALSKRAQEEYALGKTPEVGGQALYNPGLGDRLLINIEPALKSENIKLVELPTLIVDPGCADFIRSGISSDLTPRPGLQIFLDWLKDSNNLSYLMEQAGV